MEATEHFTSAQQVRPIEYNQYPWGDLILGTEQQLRAIGIGVDQDFPPLDSNKSVTVTDCLGRKVNLERWLDAGVYRASIAFPDWPQDPQLEPHWERFVDGVMVDRSNSRSDDYKGSKEALIAAGLAQEHQFPGEPGNCKTLVRISPSGAVYGGKPHSNPPKEFRCMPGGKEIEKKWRRDYLLRLFVDPKTLERRMLEFEVRKLWVKEAREKLKRPPSLVEVAASSRKAKSHLRLAAVNGVAV